MSNFFSGSGAEVCNENRIIYIYQEFILLEKLEYIYNSIQNFAVEYSRRGSGQARAHIQAWNNGKHNVEIY